MLERIRAIGYPVALVAQDGLEHQPVPWDDIDALFLGGTTTSKLSAAAADLTDEAHACGLHVHMGRVNSRRRLRHAAAIGCHSADGTQLAQHRRSRRRPDTRQQRGGKRRPITARLLEQDTLL